VLQEFLTEEGVDFQLVPPHLHHCNAAEWAIQTFKNHFIAGLCSTNKDFPIHLWDRLIPQAELTLNLLRGSQLDPTLSAWAQLHGPFDFNQTPIAPPGMRIPIHEKPSVQGTWAPHAVDGWYLGPALHSYRCYTVWSKDTQAQRICDTLTWLPTTIPVPTVSTADYILAGITDIANALRKPSPNSPLEALNDSQMTALEQLMVVLHGKKKGGHTTSPDKVPITAAPTLRVGPLPDNQHNDKLPAVSLRVGQTPTPQPPLMPNAVQCDTNDSPLQHEATIMPTHEKDNCTHDDATVAASNCSTQPRPMEPTKRQTRSMH